MAINAFQPEPKGEPRRTIADNVRALARQISRPPVTQQANGERLKYADSYATSFTKGLPHDEFGMVDVAAFETFFDALNTPDRGFNVPLGPVGTVNGEAPFYSKPRPGNNAPQAWSLRGWESPLAGHTYDLQGPDADAVGMAPAPRLGSDELAAEMAEVYAMALLRDVPFHDIEAGGGDTEKVVAALNKLEWFGGNPTDVDSAPLSRNAQNRRDGRKLNGGGLTAKTLFRGSAPGCADGPYVSQFLLQGVTSRAPNTSSVSALKQGGTQKTYSMVRDVQSGQLRKAEAADGYVLFGAQRIDQRIHAQSPGVDYMQDWAEWLDVQNGASKGGTDEFVTNETALRFIHSPRDLASYVHVDALYQAYLTACLMLLGSGAAADRGLPEPNRRGEENKLNPATRTAFALFAGPHILTLVTEVATRALKAVRRQKYNIHCRARPEVLAGITALAANGHGAQLKSAEADGAAHFAKLADAEVDGYSIVDRIAARNQGNQTRYPRTAEGDAFKAPAFENGNLLLPMAFPEGSPMHPAYGAGHATVAGACVTVLKAFFEMYENDGTTLLDLNQVGKREGEPEGPINKVFYATDDGQKLKAQTPPDKLTLAGELNKLAANISIGRNMAGVHYYSDYYDSLRMGERIAVGMLQEQALTYGELVSMTLPTFDGDRLTIKGTLDRAGSPTAHIEIDGGDVDEWFTRHLADAVEVAQATDAKSSG
ncbi:MAG: bromoperoxidase [Pseudomonadota bacterium]